jgi:tetratricopeptide (TPR) repeat protein/transcriptional regulator with XRE-family HTH domain
VSDGGFADMPGAGAVSIRSKADLAAEVRRCLVAYERRTGAPVTRSALARKVDVSTSSMYAYLNGTTLPSTVTFDRILAALGAPATVRQRLATARDDLAEGDKRPTAAAPGPAPPRELLPDVPEFTGRVEQLAVLDRLLASSDAPAPPVVISAVSGTAGVGKTALAIHWAHRAREQFPDGHLYVDLRGYGPEQPMQPAEALEGFLRSLGVAGAAIPRTLAQRAARFRSLLVDRKMLILLDNARAADQVRDLLPGTPTCAVVVTSRDSLAGLVARNGARRIELDLLIPDEAVALLRALLGHRVDAEPVAATALADRCARLPLALRIAAELAAGRPSATLTDLVSELDRHRLDLLTAGDDQQTAVRAVFSWSYRHLPAEAAQAFGLLGLHPGRHIDQYALAALLAGGPDEARQSLHALARAHLVREVHPGRYGMHDLLRAYAVECGQLTEPDEVRDAAQTRLLDWYLHTASRAADQVNPSRRRIPEAPRGPETTGPPIADRDDALAWLDSQLPNLLAAIEHVAAHGPGKYVWQFAHTLWHYFDNRGILPAWISSHQRALSTIDADRDPWAHAETLHNLANAYWRSGRYTEARDHYQQALPLRRRVDDQLGEANTLSNLGLINHDLGNYQPAIGQLTEALTFYRRLGLEWGEANSLNVLGNCLRGQGQYRESLEYHGQAALLYRNIGHQRGEAGAMGNLGRAHEGLRDYDCAIEHHKQALALFRQVGDPNGEAGCMINLGTLYCLLGDHDQAESCQSRALAIAIKLGELPLQSEALNGLGTVHTATGRYAGAAEHHRQALTLSVQIGNRREEAVAYRGAAEALQHLGQSAPASDHWQRALEVFDALGAPEADEIRAALISRPAAPAPHGPGDTGPVSGG